MKLQAEAADAPVRRSESVKLWTKRCGGATPVNVFVVNLEFSSPLGKR